MDLSNKRFTRKRVIAAIFGAVVVLAAVLWFIAFKKIPRTDMTRMVPASAVGFIEVDSLSDLTDGLTSTKAWKTIGPIFGVSGQLGALGPAADFFGRTGFGPDEAVVAGRAQYCIVITGIETETGSNADGPYIHFKPHFALEIDTHSKAEVAARLVKDRAATIAARIYGGSPGQDSESYIGDEIYVFHGPTAGHQLVAASHGSMILVANDLDSIKSCIDVIQGRTASLADDQTLKKYRPTIDHKSAVFAYLTAGGITKISGIAPAVFFTRFTTDPEVIGAAGSLFGHVSSQIVSGLLYSSQFESGHVVDRYLTVLQTGVAAGLEQALSPGSLADSGLLKIFPENIQSFTLIRVADVGDMPERTLKALAPNLDIVGALAMRQFVISLRHKLGLSPEESLGKFTGDQLGVVKFSGSDPIAMCISVKDKQGLTPYLQRYLTYENSSVSTEQYKGVDVAVSSFKDGRCAAFVGDWLVLATHDQIASVIDAQAANKTVAQNSRIMTAVASQPDGSSIISCNVEPGDAAQMMLAVSKITRTTNGSPELLQLSSIHKAESDLVPTISFTEFRDSGVYTETRSPVGNFSLLDMFTPGS